VNTETKEAQNQSQIDAYDQMGPVTLGPWTSHIWRSDPRHLCFLLSRYKFASKLLAGRRNVVEIGCGDAVGTPIVLQSVDSICCIDFEPLVLEDAKKRYEKEKESRVNFLLHDVLDGPLTNGPFEGGFSLDVIEHILPEKEIQFLNNIADSLSEHGIFIMGTPNITASEYASPASKAGHINLKSADSLRELMQHRFHNVFIFSMNDEVVHTGYYPMAHYIVGLGVGVK
jgi:2-polyprenyl-3-methyl-5-hydroxy-6-metoxy-1,4-benzoquinol methylase